MALINPIEWVIDAAKKGDKRVLLAGAAVVGGGIGLWVYLHKSPSGGSIAGRTGTGQSLSQMTGDASGGGGGGGGADLSGLAPTGDTSLNPATSALPSVDTGALPTPSPLDFGSGIPSNFNLPALTAAPTANSPSLDSSSFPNLPSLNFGSQIPTASQPALPALTIPQNFMPDYGASAVGAVPGLQPAAASAGAAMQAQAAINSSLNQRAGAIYAATQQAAAQTQQNAIMQQEANFRQQEIAQNQAAAQAAQQVTAQQAVSNAIIQQQSAFRNFEIVQNQQAAQQAAQQKVYSTYFGGFVDPATAALYAGRNAPSGGPSQAAYKQLLNPTPAPSPAQQYQMLNPTPAPSPAAVYRMLNPVPAPIAASSPIRNQGYTQRGV